MMRAQLMWAPALLLMVSLSTAQAVVFFLNQTCPGNLVLNGDFEYPDPSKPFPPKIMEARTNSHWGWYPTIPGWRPTCNLKVDWQPTKMEVQRNAVAAPAEGYQNLELLPNGTGIACQEITLKKGQQYKLSFYYGLLQTIAWRPPYVGQFVKFYTKAMAAVRPANYTPTAKPGNFPQDPQGFNILVEADTTLPMYKTHQWNKWEVNFTAPADNVTLAFINSHRSHECGSCGSLLDAVCLQPIGPATGASSG